MFKKILIANRGECALRILRACQELGIETVAVHSTADSESKHVRLADESVCIGPPHSKDSYLNMPSLLSAATISNADAIHPGIGFLAENSIFAEMVEEHGFVFIGPSSAHIRSMGDKITAKKIAKELGLPVVPGSEGSIQNAMEASRIAKDIGFPVLIKASGGGGGRGMKVAYAAEEVEEAFNLAQQEAEAHFGNSTVYIEKYLATPRHIEVQVLGDKHGNVIHLGERDCSLQRRHQKIFEEAPSPVISSDVREKLGTLVCDAMKKLGYYGPGTVEFLYEGGHFYFIEMNTRLQIEHPISEMITGIDIVQEQIRVAAGLPLSVAQKDITFKGHSIECRINAEHPFNFIPSPGKIKNYHVPGGFGIRVDSHLYNGYTVPPYYDSLVGKLIVYGEDRGACLKRLSRALNEYVIDGIETTLNLHRQLVQNADIVQGKYDIHWLEAFLEQSKDEEAA